MSYSSSLMDEVSQYELVAKKRECYVFGTRRAKELCWIMSITPGVTVEYAERLTRIGGWWYAIQYSATEKANDLLSLYVTNNMFLDKHVEEL